MLSFFFLLLKFVWSNDIVLVERDPSDLVPNDICPNSCKRPVFATPENINQLTKLLREQGVNEAAVAGKDCTPGNFLVDAGGNVRCYGRNLGSVRYAFCYANYKCPPRPCKPCRPYRPYPCRPCRPYRPRPYPCPYPPRPYPCPPYPPRPYPCPPYPCPYPPRPYPCPPKPYCPSGSFFPNPCAPKCPVIRFNKACVDQCGNVTSAIEGGVRCYIPPRYGPYYGGGY